MNRKRELLKQALIALENDRQFISDWGGYASEYFQKKHDLEGDISAHDVLMREIKAELEKPEQEPVAYMTTDSKHLIFADKCNDKSCIPLYTSPPQQKPLSEDKAFAYISSDRASIYIPSMEDKEIFVQKYMAHWIAGWDKLYLSPPQQKALSDDETSKIKTGTPSSNGNYEIKSVDYHKYARYD